MKSLKLLHRDAVASFFGLMVLMALPSSTNRGIVVTDNSGKNDRATNREGWVALPNTGAGLSQANSNPQDYKTKWNFVMKNPGCYDLWVSSLTYNTLHLRYKEKITITTALTRIEKIPVGNELVTNYTGVKKS